MKHSCNVIRDLLPLYADDACSEDSRSMVEEHLTECPDCRIVLRRLRSNEIEKGLQQEKEDVIEYGMRKFRKRSATVGSTVSGMFMIPILAFLIINLTAGTAMGWFFILLAALAVAGSLILVPILVPEDKAFWMLCAFTASLLVLLGVTCMVSRGNWFWIASSSVLFGLSVIFLPFAIRARPLRKWVGKTNKALLVLAVDMVLFLNMMNTIRLHNQGSNNFVLVIGLIAGAALVVLSILKNNGRISK
ncbi:MAG: zf-HC2 domain-containing protein [Clostridia bacterium]|nr:zf-HC2 domain-containing protein [Clostridia bacterium]